MKSFFTTLSPFIIPIQPMLEALINAGATPYLVGGCVRDLVIGRHLKDLDIELHGITLATTDVITVYASTANLVFHAYGDEASV